MTLFLETLIGGLLAGTMYSLVAIGFVLIYKASGVFNFAQGAILLFAALLFVTLLEAGLPFALALVLTVAALVALAVLIERLVLRPLTHRSPMTLFMATLGLSYVIEGVAQLLWGTQVHELDLGLADTPLEFAGVLVSSAAGVSVASVSASDAAGVSVTAVESAAAFGVGVAVAFGFSVGSGVGVESTTVTTASVPSSYPQPCARKAAPIIKAIIHFFFILSDSSLYAGKKFSASNIHDSAILCKSWPVLSHIYRLKKHPDSSAADHSQISCPLSQLVNLCFRISDIYCVFSGFKLHFSAADASCRASVPEYEHLAPGSSW